MNHVAALRDLLVKISGKRIRNIRRIFFVYRGMINRQVGALELTFEKGLEVVFDSGGDGESLVASVGHWEDPFEKVSSVENDKYISRHGKWSAFDVTSEDGYRDLVGLTIDSVDTVLSPDGKCVGVVLRVAGHASLRADVVADDLHVQFS